MSKIIVALYALTALTGLNACPEQPCASGASGRDAALARYDLALSEEKLARFLEAEYHYRQAADMLQSLDGPDASTTVAVLGRLAGVYVQTGRNAMAETLLQKCLVSRTATFGPKSKQVAFTLADLAFLRMVQKRYADAEPLLRRSAAICENTCDQDDPHFVGAVLSTRASILFAQNEKNQALEVAEKAWNILSRSVSPPPIPQARALTVMGLVYASQGHIDEAVLSFESAIRLATGAYGGDHPSVAYLLARYSEMLNRTHRKREAREAWSRAGAILKRNASASGLGLTADLAMLEHIPSN